MDYYIEHLLGTLEKKPRQEWPTNIEQLEQFLATTTEVTSQKILLLNCRPIQSDPSIL